MSNVPPFKQRFEIETSVGIVQPAGSYSFTYIVGRLSATTGEGGKPAVEIISTAVTGPDRYSLPDPFPRFTELVIPVLRSIPEVEVRVETFIPERRAVTRALVVVELLRDTLPDPASLRKLYAAARTAYYRRRERQRKREAQESRQEDEQQRPKVDLGTELMPELARKVRRGETGWDGVRRGETG